MAFGRVTHRRKKMSARYYEREHKSKEQLKRVVHARVYLSRGSRPTNVGRVHGFFAQACIGKHGSRYSKCGTYEFGRTPTITVKKALVAFGRDRGIK